MGQTDATKLFQISEPDLADLEKLVPELCERLYASMLTNLDNSTRVKVRRVQKIIQDIRWNYGPPQEIERVEP